MKGKFYYKKMLFATGSAVAAVVGVYVIASYLCPVLDDDSNALTYSSNTNISFTIKPRLSIALSTDSLTIDNLVPGTTSDSNSVTVTVASNTPYGYTLSAGVGSTEPTDPYYNTSDLVHDNTTAETPITNKFSSIDISASLSALDTDNTWGYSTSVNGGTNWSTYSGLSHTEAKTLLDTSAAAQPSTIDFKIAARSATTQASGTYNNVITFYAVGKPEPHYIYDEVKKQSRGTQVAVDLQAEITRDNSGVYEYNSAVFGESSDASNTSKIYYYRGILDDTFVNSDGHGSIGSSGDGELHPNYVILSPAGDKATTDTCWRIVRTTGSGGVKMIYNGTWTGTTCANATTNARPFVSPYNNSSSPSRRIALVGYTYNPTYGDNDVTTSASVDSVFGSNSEYTSNSANSAAKINLDTWYNNTIAGYTNILEKSAGYCNDRSAYSDKITSSLLSTVVPYTTSTGEGVYFGAYGRNMNATNAGKLPSLSCARNVVDLYTVSGANTGNGQLYRPTALLTADEASLAGSGSLNASHGSASSPSSYLRTGSSYWLLSPGARDSDGKGVARQFSLNPGGALESFSMHASYGVRPVISLDSSVEYITGSGTAADPWVVPTM